MLTSQTTDLLYSSAKIRSVTLIIALESFYEQRMPVFTPRTPSKMKHGFVQAGAMNVSIYPLYKLLEQQI